MEMFRYQILVLIEACNSQDLSLYHTLKLETILLWQIMSVLIQSKMPHVDFENIIISFSFINSFKSIPTSMSAVSISEVVQRIQYNVEIE